MTTCFCVGNKPDTLSFTLLCVAEGIMYTEAGSSSTKFMPGYEYVLHSRKAGFCWKMQWRYLVGGALVMQFLKKNVDIPADISMELTPIPSPIFRFPDFMLLMIRWHHSTGQNQSLTALIRLRPFTTLHAPPKVINIH